MVRSFLNTVKGWLNKFISYIFVICFLISCTYQQWATFISPDWVEHFPERSIQYSKKF